MQNLSLILNISQRPLLFFWMKIQHKIQGYMVVGFLLILHFRLYDPLCVLLDYQNNRDNNFYQLIEEYKYSVQQNYNKR